MHVQKLHKSIHAVPRLAKINSKLRSRSKKYMYSEYSALPIQFFH